MINTGWTGGSYGKGHRIPLKYTRAMINAALNGDLDFVEYVKEPFFNLKIPRSCPGVPAEMLNPKNTWSNKREYDKTAKKLTKMFQENFKNMIYLVLLLKPDLVLINKNSGYLMRYPFLYHLIISLIICKSLFSINALKISLYCDNVKFSNIKISS